MKDNKKYYEMFQRKERSQGDFFVCLKDNASHDLKELIKDIHFVEFGGAMPNDWIYKQIQDAFYAWDEYEHKDEFVYADCADHFHNDLWKWSGEPFAHELLNETLENGYKDFFDLIRSAQTMAISRIREQVNIFLEESYRGINPPF